MGLRDLDDRLVPALATRLRALLDRVGGGREAAVGSVARLVEPGRPGPLRRLDDRFASRGPLALLRDVPQLGVLMVSAVFLTGAGVALARSGPESVQARQEQAVEQSLPLTLGPAPGTEIVPFFAQSRDRAVALSRRAPEDRYLSLVSLVDEVTPDGAADLLKDSRLTVRRAYVRAPVKGPGPEVLEVELSQEIVPGLTALFAETARRKADEQREFLMLAASIPDGTDAQFKAEYEQAARTAGQEAAAYRTPCACVIALVVEGSAKELAELPALPAVRGVELAPRGAALEALDITPLPPESTGVVPEPTKPGS